MVGLGHHDHHARGAAEVVDGALGAVEAVHQLGVGLAQRGDAADLVAVEAEHDAHVEARDQRVVEHRELFDVGTVPFQQGHHRGHLALRTGHRQRQHIAGRFTGGFIA
ncbi:hypothetical protein D3C72_2103630 [compost metagenome]